MSTKTTGKSSAKKDPTKKATAHSKAEKKLAKSAEEKTTAEHPEPSQHKEASSHEDHELEAAHIDSEELEEQEAEAASGGGPGNNAAAIAAASGPGEMSASFKNFRHHPDMENFYRFIYENDLRHEALTIIDEIMTEKQQRKTGKAPKSSSHTGHAG